MLGGLALVFAVAAAVGLVAAALPASTVGDDVDWLVAVALLLPVGGTLLVTLPSTPRIVAAAGRSWLLAAVDAAAFAYVLALDLGYDGYYGDGTRFIDRGPVGPGAMLVLGLLTAATMLLARRRPQAGAFASGLLLWLYLPVAFYLHAGH